MQIYNFLYNIANFLYIRLETSFNNVYLIRKHDQKKQR